MTIVHGNIRFCDKCVDNDVQKKRSNYTLNECWHCSDECYDDDYDDDGNLINKNINMCDVCRDHKTKIKNQDDEIGIDPTHCYCCGKYGSDELPSCFYCDRISCYSCSFKDKKRVRSCMSCHPLEISDDGERIVIVCRSTIIDGISTKAYISESLYMRNSVRRFITVNNNFIKVKNNDSSSSNDNHDDNKRKLSSSNDNSNDESSDSDSNSDEYDRANLFFCRIIETINTAHKKEKKEAEKQLHDVLDSTLRKELDYNEDLAAVVKKMEAKGYNFHFHEDENSSVKRTNKHIVCDDKNNQKRQKINNNNNDNNNIDSSDDSSEGSFDNIISTDSDESSEESF